MVVRRRPLAADDIAQVWDHIADDSLRAADRWIVIFYERIEGGIDVVSLGLSSAHSQAVLAVRHPLEDDDR
jgi:plasmid stabilization system protein ParE